MGGGRSSWGIPIILVAVCGCGGKSAPTPPAPPVTVGARAPELHFEGRFDDSAAAGPRFELPGSAIWLRFSGTGAKVTLGEHSLEMDEYGMTAHNWYDVVVDGRTSSSFKADEGVGTYMVASGLTAGEHQVIVRKRTESYVGDAQFLGFELEGGAALLQAKAPSRRIEFIGDSITAGFGVDGPDTNCLFSAETENFSHTYASLTAQALQADQISMAASGAGAYRNWGGSTRNTIGDLYDRTLITEATSRWNFSRWTPDVVVFNLGTGDFTSGDPGRDAFLSSYRKLLAHVRQNYPSALLVVAVGPMLSDLWPAGAHALTQGRSYVSDLVAEANAAGDARVKYVEFPNQDHSATFGCKSHPSAATQKQMADQLTAYLRQQMSW